MTREEFDTEIANDTTLGLLADRVKYRALKQMALNFKRPDVADILDDVLRAIDIAVAASERLTAPVTELS